MGDQGASPSAASRSPPTVELACHGWQGYVEQTLLTWIDNPTVSADDLEHLCERSLDAILTPTDLSLTARSERLSE